MVAGPQQQMPAFDPVDAGAMLRRARVAKVRQRVTNEFQTRITKTTTVSHRQPGGPAQSTAPQSVSSGAPARSPRSRPRPVSESPSAREIPDLPPTPQSRNMGANRMPTPQQGQSFDQAQTNNQRQANQQQPAMGPDADRKPQPAERPDQTKAREDHKKTYQPAPPLQTPPPAASSGENAAADQNRAAADRQMDAANGTNDYAAQARARGAAERAAKNAKKAAAQSDDDQGGIAERGVSWVYSLLFQGGGAADELPIDGGIVASAAESGNLYQAILTIFPSFDDKMKASFGTWLPQKFDIMNTRKQEMLFHFGEICKGIAATTEMMIYILIALLFPILLGVAFAFITNPLLGIKAFLSVF